MRLSEKYIRLGKSFLKLGRAIERKEKARAFRIWVEGNPKVHILNYLYYRIKERKVIQKIREEGKWN